MGNQQCNECVDKGKQNGAYGAFQVVHQNSNVYALVEKKVEKNPLLQKKIIQKLQQRKNLKHSHIVKLLKYEVNVQSFGYSVLMYFEYISKNLTERIQELTAKNLNFTQRQLFAIIYGVQSALLKLNEYDIRHSCINTDTIVCKNGFYKITDVSSTTYLNSYQLATKGDQKQFLSEKLLQSLSHKSLQPNYQLKDDLFSLGMIILSLVNHKQPNYYYFYHNAVSLNTQAIENSLREMQRLYSSKLFKKVRSLLFEGLEVDRSQITNLTDSLQQLDEQMARVLSKFNIISKRH